MSSPLSSFTIGMFAGTPNWNIESKLLHERSWFLASLIAALVAQWTEAARSRGGSPEAAIQISFNFSINIYKTSKPRSVREGFNCCKNIYYLLCMYRISILDLLVNQWLHEDII